MKHALTALLVIALAGVGYALFAQTGENMTYYYEVDQVTAADYAGQRIKLAGIVAEGSVEKEASTLLTRFQIEGDSKSRLVPVEYTGALPDIFRDGIQVVVTGEFDAGGRFVADELLAKCPSKYQAKGDPADFEHMQGYEIEYDHRTAAPVSTSPEPAIR